ncbi:MAG: RnfABCDGE type electron transport complex subunit B [Clostridia bacterium]|nr:RnfABCDGE type electron transport complex subunit B [Clostridia bacterium]
MDWLIPVLLALGVLGVLGVIFGLLLGFIGKKFEVKVDERVAAVREALAGANCGACGYAGCDAYAQAVVDGKAPLTACAPAGKVGADKIAEIMGVSADIGERMTARVRCNGTCDNVQYRYEYEGPHSCRAAAALSGGPKECSYSCLGYGDCYEVCKFNAITVENGVASINDDYCTGCGACVTVCPRSCIALIPKNRTVVVRCRNTETGKTAREHCKVACIGCKRCEKVCPSEAIKVNNGVAEIDPEKCTRCGACVAACPMKCIHNYFEGLHEAYDWK